MSGGDLGDDHLAGGYRDLRRVVRIRAGLEEDRLYVGQALGLERVEACLPVAIPTSAEGGNVIVG